MQIRGDGDRGVMRVSTKLQSNRPGRGDAITLLVRQVQQMQLATKQKTGSRGHSCNPILLQMCLGAFGSANYELARLEHKAHNL